MRTKNVEADCKVFDEVSYGRSRRGSRLLTNDEVRCCTGSDIGELGDDGFPAGDYKTMSETRGKEAMID